MNIIEKIIKEYPLTTKIDCELDCYSLAKKRYLVFWRNNIEKNNIEKILNIIEEKTNNQKFDNFRTIIVVGNTNDNFKKSDLFYFNGVNIFVVFYLINEQKNKIFYNDSWIFTLGLNYRRFVKKLNKLLGN